MGPLRGVILILFGLAAIVRGWTLHGQRMGIAFGLGVAALALGAWSLWRAAKESKRL